eukprot:jgi/Psemu1/35778/gm1.35778_g
MATKTAAYLTMKDLKGATKKKRQWHQLQNRLLIGLAAANFPQVGDVVFEQLMAVGRMVAMERLNLFAPGSDDSSKKTVEFDSTTQISPHCTTIQNYSDKGAGILVKVGYFCYDEDEDVVVEVNHDFDIAGDDEKSGGKAIKYSLEKYSAEEGEQIMTSRGGSDSGGCFTGQARENGVETVYGPGHLDNRNVTQLIHAL